MNRGDVSEISTYIINAIENDFSGNMIDVCPVGALTDNTFRFASRVWFTKPMDAHRNCTKCSGKAVLWMKGEEVLRVSARKDMYNEVEEWICNDCRYENKSVGQWTIEGPRHISKDSVISQNHYEHIDLQKLKLDINRQIKFQGGKQIEEHYSRAQFEEESKKALQAAKK
jgi:NADH-quinone oxidoreductase subunit G